MNITVMSFAFKRELMPSAELVFDVRFIKNPYYEPNLASLCGLDGEVGLHIELDPDFTEFYERLTDLVTLMLRRFEEKERETMTIAIGCTGGQHRSVYIAQKLDDFLKQAGYNTNVIHRDLEQSK